MTRLEEIEQQLQIIEEQLKYTKLEVLIKNCHRTKQILIDERDKINNAWNEIRKVDNCSGIIQD